MAVENDSLAGTVRTRHRSRSRLGETAPSPARTVPSTNRRDQAAIQARKDIFLEEFEKRLGNVTATCKAIGITPACVTKWKQQDSVFKQAFEDVNEVAIDYAESKLMANIRSGKEASIFFFLKCKAKHRGYIERQELTGANGDPIRVAQEEVSKQDVLSVISALGLTGNGKSRN